MSFAAAVLLFALCCSPQTRADRQADQLRWWSEHAQEIAAQEKAAERHRIEAALREQLACHAIGESMRMHVDLWLAYTKDGFVNIRTRDEAKIILKLWKRFKPCLAE